MEASSVTGPAKNLIGFCQWLSTAEGARTGLSVAIVTFDRSPTAVAGHGFADAARAAGIDTHVMRERHRFDFGVVAQLRAIAAATRPDIIQTHNSKSHLLVRWLPELRARSRWFAFQHGYTYTDLKQRLYNQVDRLTLRSADRVVSVCQAFAPRLIALGVKPERIRVLHNAAMATPPSSDLQRAQLRNELGIRDGESVVLSIGRLSREKGHADLLRGVARLRSSGKPWKLVLVGIGPERERLGQLARALGIGERVVFAGFRATVTDFFAIADAFVLPSHSEGSSNVLLEAMMARVPIVATRAGGNPEIVLDGKTGVLVPVAEPEALAGALARLLSEPGLVSQFVDAASTRAAQVFSLDRYRRRLASFYAEALGRAHEGSGYSSAYPGDAN